MRLSSIHFVLLSNQNASEAILTQKNLVKFRHRGRKSTEIGFSQDLFTKTGTFDDELNN